MDDKPITSDRRAYFRQKWKESRREYRHLRHESFQAFMERVYKLKGEKDDRK